jgi:hypothetical protein
MPDGGLAYVDLRNDRITMFSPELMFRDHVRLPKLGSPVGPITADSLLFIAESGMRGPQRKLLVFDLARDRLIASMPLLVDPRALGLDSIMASPIQRDSGRILLRGTGDYLVWITDDARKVTGFIPPPAFDPGLPDSLDMEDERADLKSIFGVVLEEDVELLQRRRRLHYPRENIAQIDSSGRLWVLTNRRGTTRATYIDVYDQTKLLGSLAIAGRVVAFRIHNSLLVTMNRDFDESEDGIPHQRFTWYRIVYD